MKPEMARLRQTAVQNHTATMLEIGSSLLNRRALRCSSLLNRSAEQSRKLTDVEAQVGGDGTRVPTSPLPPELQRGAVPLLHNAGCCPEGVLLS